ncbi:MAG TPA: signal peptidase I [Patescibacteria group bacterium]|nr:signal peptidase I [Patescibacteria group bacterium]
MLFIKKKSTFFLIFWRYLSRATGIIITFLVVLMAIKFFIFDTGKVDGPSMEPNFSDDQIFIINKFIYLFRQPERYDVVQLLDLSAKKLILKRVIGLPGETVVIRRGKVFIENRKDDDASDSAESAALYEPYLAQGIYTKLMAQQGAVSWVIPQDHYFVLGDNRPRSSDSRVWGAIHRSDIVGLVVFKLPHRDVSSLSLNRPVAQ